MHLAVFCTLSLSSCIYLHAHRSLAICLRIVLCGPDLSEHNDCCGLEGVLAAIPKQTLWNSVVYLLIERPSERVLLGEIDALRLPYGSVSPIGARYRRWHEKCGSLLHRKRINISLARNAPRTAINGTVLDMQPKYPVPRGLARETGFASGERQISGASTRGHASRRTIGTGTRAR